MDKHHLCLYHYSKILVNVRYAVISCQNIICRHQVQGLRKFIATRAFGAGKGRPIKSMGTLYS